MKNLSIIVENTLKRYVGSINEKIQKSIIESLENRLLKNISNLSNFKEAKNAFKKRYFTEILTLVHGNISKASDMAKINRRQLHRICNELKIDSTFIRKEMIRTNEYLKMDIHYLIEEKINNLYKEKKVGKKEKINRIYFNLSNISRDISDNLEIEVLPYPDALFYFEKNFFKKLLKTVSNDISKASDISNISKRSIFRKIKSLGIES